jgi:hypothetical protein
LAFSLTLPVSALAAATLLIKEGDAVVLNTTNTPLSTILDNFSELLQADIYIIGGDDQVRITHYQRDTDPLHLLASVLKAYSYAVVYREGRGKVRSLEAAVGPSLPGGRAGAGFAGDRDTIEPPLDPDRGEVEEAGFTSDIETAAEIAHRQQQQMRRHFEKEIENLREMMASGEADDFYPQPEDRLTDLEERLAEMADE